MGMLPTREGKEFCRKRLDLHLIQLLPCCTSRLSGRARFRARINIIAAASSHSGRVFMGVGCSLWRLMYSGVRRTTPIAHVGPARVWAPAELAVLFGANPKRPVMLLRVCKAFYGLVQSPRCWFNDVPSRMRILGWNSIFADRCLFLFYDDDTGEMIGVAGIHVDDFLIRGSHPKLFAAELSRKRPTGENSNRTRSSSQDATSANCQTN